MVEPRREVPIPTVKRLANLVVVAVQLAVGPGCSPVERPRPQEAIINPAGSVLAAWDESRARAAQQQLIRADVAWCIVFSRQAMFDCFLVLIGSVSLAASVPWRSSCTTKPCTCYARFGFPRGICGLAACRAAHNQTLSLVFHAQYLLEGYFMCGVA